MEISTPCRIATPHNFITKFGIHDCVRDVTPHANFGADRLSVGSPQIREI